jgi:glycogen debranching enzyme
MYDSPPVVFNTTTNHMQLWDVGLNALLVRDCQDLAKIATILGLPDDAKEVTQRGTALAQLMNQTLWDDKTGIYANKLSDSLSFYPRLSPTLFYPLLARIASDEQATSMIDHLTNSSEFCVNKACKYSIPSIARNDPAFGDNNYWRGRTWGPMNFLVYIGLQNYDHLPTAHAARQLLCSQAASLLLGDWLDSGHVQENYNSVSGQGCDVGNADPFYHWGALNAFINILEYSSNV